mmetsp:Transcript_24092/g.32305  ORF Transcript_24092/g.32305 Transcript_24092/m.32305 type:complete len:103 (-) Transcript_24092:1749-2057(-)
MQARAMARSAPIYGYIDSSNDYFRNDIEHKLRSRINVTFRIGDKNVALETKFAQEAESEGLIGLKGHSWVGGCRVTLNNAMPFEGAYKLIDFMRAFKARNPL